MSGRTRRRRRPCTLHPQLVAGRRPRPPGSRGRTGRAGHLFQRQPRSAQRWRPRAVHQPPPASSQRPYGRSPPSPVQRPYRSKRLQLRRAVPVSWHGGFLSGHLVVRKFLKFGRDVVDLGNKFFTFLFERGDCGLGVVESRSVTQLPPLQAVKAKAMATVAAVDRSIWGAFHRIPHLRTDGDQRPTDNTPCVTTLARDDAGGNEQAHLVPMTDTPA